MPTLPLNLLDSWLPGCWCVAVLKICDEGAEETERQLTRFPEQWAYMLWRPMDVAIPHVRPDRWGLTVGQPWDEVRHAVGTAPLWRVGQESCAWSSWLAIALAFPDELAPWLVEKIRTVQIEQMEAERQRNLAWYASSAKPFDVFLGKVLGTNKLGLDFGELPQGSSSSQVVTGCTTLAAGTPVAAYLETRLDGSMCVWRGTERLHPAACIRAYDRGVVGLMTAFMAVRTGLSVQNPERLLDLIPSCFSSCDEFLAWADDLNPSSPSESSTPLGN